MSDVSDLQAGLDAAAALVPAVRPIVTVLLHGLIKRPITADDVAVPLTGPELHAALRAALSRRITTGRWSS